MIEEGFVCIVICKTMHQIVLLLKLMHCVCQLEYWHNQHVLCDDQLYCLLIGMNLWITFINIIIEWWIVLNLWVWVRNKELFFFQYYLWHKNRQSIWYNPFDLCVNPGVVMLDLLSCAVSAPYLPRKSLQSLLPVC